MCCTGAKWKREVVQDHKFDFVDVHEYRVTGFFTRLRYAFVYIFVIKSVLVYLSDIYTVVAMMANDYWSGNILAESDSSSTIKVPFTIGKWIFLGCIIFSFLLLAWESRKARMIIRSRDISYAFTNIMANDYYSMKSYDHFCFFSQINNSKKKKDEFAFFVFFTFKGWKRLLLADAPRQVINALTLYSFGKAFNFTTDISKYYNNDDGQFSFVRAGILCTMIFTVVIWAGSAILLTVAAIMYIPLLCYIQGNLKEYCCHKIDKRIAELMKRKTKKRVQREAEFAKREAAGDFRHLQDKKGRFKEGHAPLPQPTLPAINLNDDELYGEGKSDIASSYKRANSQKSAGGGGNNYPGTGYGQGYPPPPSMADLSYNGGYSDPYGQYQQRYELSDGGVPGDSSYSLATQGQQQAYPYPSQTSLNMHTNDSMLSFNDEKMSIKSRDPLIGSGPGANNNVSGADLSQTSLHDAPSYHTHQEDDDGLYGYNMHHQQNEQNYANPANNYGAYDYKRTSPQDRMQYQQQQQQGYQNQFQNQQQRQYEYEPDPQHPYSDPPYALEDHDEAFANDVQQQQQYLQSYGDASQQQDQTNSGTQYPPASQQQQQHSSSNNQLRQPDPMPRGVSVAGRSEISTMYFMEERDRASIADSHLGAFDLDDYGRASIFNPGAGQSANGWQGHGQGQGQRHGNHQLPQRRGSNLEYLDEADEGPQDYDQRHQQYPKQDRRR